MKRDARHTKTIISKHTDTKTGEKVAAVVASAADLGENTPPLAPFALKCKIGTRAALICIAATLAAAAAAAAIRGRVAFSAITACA